MLIGFLMQYNARERRCLEISDKISFQQTKENNIMRVLNECAIFLGL